MCLADDGTNKLQTKSYDRIVKMERDLEYEKQLVDQKLQAALKQKGLEEKKSTAKLPKLSIVRLAQGRVK